MSNLRKTCKAGEVIFLEGDNSDCGYLIESGVVELSVEKSSEKIILANIEKGELFGEVALIDGGNRGITAIATAECTLLRIMPEHFIKRLEAAGPLVDMLVKVLLRRVRDIYELWLTDGKAISSKKFGRLMDDKTYQQLHLLAKATILEQGCLAQALEKKEFELHYQPIVSLKDNKLSGFEALIRWRKKGEIIPPDEFIETLEESGLIIPVGYWVMEQACHDFAHIKEFIRIIQKNPAKLFMAINVSGKQFSEPDLINKMKQIVKDSDISPEDIKLEITESALVHNTDDAVRILEQAKKEKFRLALDDFGTGFSSLSYLHKFPIDTLKIDKSFTVNMLNDDASMRIVNSIVGLAEGLGLDIVSEGIETEQENDVMAGLECTYGQGYLFSKPMPLIDLEKWLENYLYNN